MASSSPVFRSYDALAEAALEDPSWPSEYQPQARSLAAIFSKLDREVELEWLVDRLAGRPQPNSGEVVWVEPGTSPNDPNAARKRRWFDTAR